jgi:putative acetyltransferase
MARPSYPLRPFLTADVIGLRELYAQSIEELTQDDYDENQRLAWAGLAGDGPAFAKRLGDMLTLVIQIGGDYAGFASLKDGTHLEMLYVHPWHVRRGVGSALADALERIAAARGAEAITVDASDTTLPFFEDRGYVATQRNTMPVADEWLANTTMTKRLAPAAAGPTT